MSWTQPKAGCETNFGVHLILGTNLCPSNVVNSFIPTTLHMPLTGLKKKGNLGYMKYYLFRPSLTCLNITIYTANLFSTDHVTKSHLNTGVLIEKTS